MTHHPWPDSEAWCPLLPPATLAGIPTVQRAGLVGLAVRLLGRRGAAEDAVREASLRAVRGTARCRRVLRAAERANAA